VFIFDDSELTQTAEAIRALNPHAAAYPLESLISHMKGSAAIAYPNEGDNGYVSTLGYVLTIWTSKDTGARHVKASVSSYTVMQGLKAFKPRAKAKA